MGEMAVFPYLIDLNIIKIYHNIYYAIDIIIFRTVSKTCNRPFFGVTSKTLATGILLP